MRAVRKLVRGMARQAQVQGRLGSALRRLGRTAPNTPVVVAAPNGDVFWPKAGACWPKGEGELAPNGLELAPKPAEEHQGRQN
jgi:uncharacterized lipoprotein YddW (UPF0748 family)